MGFGIPVFLRVRFWWDSPPRCSLWSTKILECQGGRWRTAREKLALVGIDEELFERSPFELSGGQMRQWPLRSILAMEPHVLVLDEPTAGLVLRVVKELMAIFKELHQMGMTIVLVTHLMDDVADFADFVYVLENGKVVRTGRPSAVFRKSILWVHPVSVPKLPSLLLIWSVVVLYLINSRLP